MFNFSAVILILFGFFGNVILISSLLTSNVNKWENGVIPLEINGNFSPIELVIINEAINSFHRETCVKFIPYKNEKNFVTIQNTATKCKASMGQLGGQQFINLYSPKCTGNIELIQHKLLQVVGVNHVENVEDDQLTGLSIQDLQNIWEMYNCKEPTRDEVTFNLSS